MATMREDGNHSKKIRIVLVEDHDLVRTAVACMLSRFSDFLVVGAIAEGGPNLLQAVDRLEPDLLLLDARIPGCDLVSDTSKLHQRYPALKVLVLSAYERHEYVIGLLDTAREKVEAALAAPGYPDCSSFLCRASYT